MLNLIGTIIPLDWLIGAGLAIAALAATWFGGRKSAKTDVKVDALKGYQKTRQRMDDADDQIVGDDPAVLRDRLRERGNQ